MQRRVEFSLKNDHKGYYENYILLIWWVNTHASSSCRQCLGVGDMFTRIIKVGEIWAPFALFYFFFSYSMHYFLTYYLISFFFILFVILYLVLVEWKLSIQGRDLHLVH